MVFPERPTGNAWQLIGQSFNQGAGIVNDFGTQQNALQALVERRTQAALEQKRLEREMTLRESEAANKAIEYSQGQDEYKRKKDESDRLDEANVEFRKFSNGSQKKIKPAETVPMYGPGFGPNGEQAGTIPAEYTTEIPTRDQLQQKAVQLGVYGDPGNKAYFDDTKPQALSLEDRFALIQKNADLRPPVQPTPYIPVMTGNPGETPRTVFVDPRNPSGPVIDPNLPKAPAATHGPKEMSTARLKMQQLTVAKQQLQNIQNKFDALKGSFSAGPGGQLMPSPGGKAFDAAIDAFRDTKTALTRVPGIGAQSDFETKLTQASLPSRGGYEDVTQQKIDQLSQLVSTLESGYSGILGSDNGAQEQPKQTGRDQKNKPYDRAIVADFLSKAGGDRKKAKLMMKQAGYNINE